MLFLYRPRETWMPFSSPRSRTQQAAYNRSLQRQFAATQRVPAAEPMHASIPPGDRMQELLALRESGALTEAEYESVAARLRSE